MSQHVANEVHCKKALVYDYIISIFTWLIFQTRALSHINITDI